MSAHLPTIKYPIIFDIIKHQQPQEQQKNVNGHTHQVESIPTVNNPAISTSSLAWIKKGSLSSVTSHSTISIKSVH